MVKTIKKNLFITNFPTRRLSPFTYLWVIFLVIFTKIKKQPLVLNIPKEIEQPYELKDGCFLYYQYDKGLTFINFVESLAKLFHLSFFWKRKKYFFPSFSSKKNAQIINSA